MVAARNPATGSIVTDADSLVNQYHQLAFFWDKFGLTKQDIQNEPARWVLTMLKIGEAETQERSEQLDILKQRRERKGR